MSSVRDWTTGFAVIGTILLGPIIAFLTVVAAEVLIDFLKERAVIAALAVLRRRGWHDWVGALVVTLS